METFKQRSDVVSFMCFLVGWLVGFGGCFFQHDASSTVLNVTKAMDSGSRIPERPEIVSQKTQTFLLFESQETQQLLLLKAREPGKQSDLGHA